MNLQGVFMNIFSDALDRLKHELRVSKDQEVAVMLGFSKTAFSERKKRGAFPDREVRALAANRPELKLDAEYICTGQHSLATKTERGQAGKVAMQKLQASTQAIVRASAALSYEPPMIWMGLLQELVFSHGLTDTGVFRVMETLKSERQVK
jgi:hypothetical protein